MTPRRRSKKIPSYHGILPVDKPAGITSHDVVDIVRRAAGQREVGHTGTLDPAATGLLVMCLGEATKFAEYFTGMTKVYRGEMTLGAVSTTQDGDGEISAVEGAEPVDEGALRRATESFLGEIMQTPPLHSAKKIDGKRLYEYARAGEEVDVPPRKVEVFRYDIALYEWPRAEFEVECGSGTYVRALVHDLGNDLGCGAYLSALRRVRVGPFRIEDAATLDELRNRAEERDARLDRAEEGAGDAAKSAGVGDAGAGGAMAEREENSARRNRAGEPVGENEEEHKRRDEWSDGFGALVWPPSRALSDWPMARVGDEGLLLLRRGHALPVEWAPLANPDRKLNWLDNVLLLDRAGHTLAVARYVPAPASPPPRALSDYRGAWFQPVKQFRFFGGG